MVTVRDFSAWKVYEGAAEGSGRSEKVWLVSDQGDIGLFKFPKIDPTTQRETTEHVSEHLAHQLGKLLEVDTARVEIGILPGAAGQHELSGWGARGNPCGGHRIYVRPLPPV